ncbi:MAG: MFS transporter [Micropepsaceae bacterium]
MRSAYHRVPRTVWALGFVSMFMDISSEMIHSLLPIFIVSGIGASAAVLGLIEGVSEATASVTKVFSGWLSDKLRKRKILTLIGYGLAAATKPIFPFASTSVEVLCARFADRVGKGIRGAPRDALIADITPREHRGAAYGLRQSLDTIGAVAGPLAALGLMMVYSGDIRAVFGWAVVPAAISVAVLFWGVREPDARPDRVAMTVVPQFREWNAFGPSFWCVVFVGGMFSLARFSEAFLLLRAQEVGLEIALVPIVLAVMNTVYALVSAPAGRWSDTVDRRALLALGLVVLMLADFVLAGVAQVGGVLLGSALWGLHMGLTQGLLSALVADAAPANLRGTAFGIFNLVSGFALLIASVVAGALWSAFGAEWTFAMGAFLALLSILSTALLSWR